MCVCENWGKVEEEYEEGASAASSVYFLSREANSPLVLDTQIIQPAETG